MRFGARLALERQELAARLPIRGGLMPREPTHLASASGPEKEARVRLGSHFAAVAPFDAPLGMAYHLDTGVPATRRARGEPKNEEPGGRERGKTRTVVGAWASNSTWTSLAGQPRNTKSSARYRAFANARKAQSNQGTGLGVPGKDVTP